MCRDRTIYGNCKSFYIIDPQDGFETILLYSKENFSDYDLTQSFYLSKVNAGITKSYRHTPLLSSKKIREVLDGLNRGLNRGYYKDRDVLDRDVFQSDSDSDSDFDDGIPLEARPPRPKDPPLSRKTLRRSARVRSRDSSTWDMNMDTMGGTRKRVKQGIRCVG